MLHFRLMGECMCVHYKSVSFLICLRLNYVDVQAVNEHVVQRKSTDMSANKTELS